MFDTNKVFSVSEFNSFIKEILNELGSFSINGEITELSITQKKGVYLTISDGKSNLKLSGYLPLIKGMDLVEKGMKVIVQGYGDIYVPYGSFSVSINRIEPEGEGSLAIVYQKLKKKLELKGYFETERKKPLPEFITKIALLTGKNSAAFSDFVKILQEHTSSIEVDFYPVIVQGENSVESILNAIRTAEYQDYDLIVLTRGGGSLEDLKSFNDIEIADAVYKSRLPFIVGVGHEKDESIADFVADLRASTPSQCAYYLLQQNQSFITNLKNSTESTADKLEGFIKSILNELMDIDTSINNILDNQVTSIKNELSFSVRLLKSYDTQSILERGFTVISRGKEQIKKRKQLKLMDEIQIRFADGKAGVEVKDLNM